MSSATADKSRTPVARLAGLPTPARTRRWPQTFAALQVPSYRLFLSSQVVATTGLSMQRIAQDWMILQLTGSVAAVGVTVALQFAPVLLFGLFGGVVADRFPKRRILMVTQTVASLVAVTLGLLSLTGAIQAWHVYLLAVVLGFVTVVDNPTRQVFVAELVGDQHIRNAVSLNSSVFQIGALVGPALAGLLIAAVGQSGAFLLNGAACLTVVLILTLIRSRSDSPATGARQRSGQLREGLAYIQSTSEVAWTIVLVAATGVLGLNMPVILTAFADDVFESGVGGYSLFNSLTAAGALLGALLSARRTATVRLRVLVTTLTLLGAVVMAGSLAPAPWAFHAILVLIGLLTLLFLTGANSLVQLTTAPEIRGRVMSVYLLVLLGGQSIGSPAVGWLIDTFGARPSMFLCGGLLAFVSVVSGLAMAHRSRLTLGWDRSHGGVRLHIIHS